jgi:N6-L-threonylcarbamoyladenine synthase
MNNKPVYILGIESSCDETSAAVSCNDKILANIIAGQTVHERYGGVVPELASRAHQQQIIPVVAAALSEAKILKTDLSAIAFTRGPGLIGSLLVGTSFAKSMALALNIPLVEVNHMQAHVIGNFASRPEETIIKPSFPFLCLTVSGGHTQLIRVDDYLKMEIIGHSLDDAAGEAFDKVAKMLGLPYPGGPEVDKLAQTGDADRYKFPHPDIPDLNFSFSGLKTSVLYFLQKQRKMDAAFPGIEMANLCASVQKTIIDILLKKLEKAVHQTGIKSVALAGGVSANRGLRSALLKKQNESGWQVHIPNFEYCTDNAGMIALYGYYKFLKGEFSPADIAPVARYPF